MIRKTSILALLLLTAVARADTVALLDGRTLEGKVAFEKDALAVTPKSGAAQNVKMSDVIAVRCDGSPVTAPLRRVTLVNGTVIGVGEILSISDREVRTRRLDGSLVTVNTALVSSIVFAPNAPAAPLPEGFVGVQPIDGDSSEGEILSGDNNVIRTSSVLFGLQEFPAGKIRVVVFRPVGESRGAYLVETNDGASYQAESIKAERGKVVLTTDLLGTLELDDSKIRTIGFGPGSAASMADVAGETAIVLRAGDKRTIKLDGKFRAAVLTLDVPPAQVPTRTVRMTLSVDGKELAKIDGLTSLTPAKSVTIPLEGAAELTIDVTASGPAVLGAAGRVSGQWVVKK